MRFMYGNNKFEAEQYDYEVNRLRVQVQAYACEIVLTTTSVNVIGILMSIFAKELKMLY